MLKRNYYIGLFVVALCATTSSYGMDFFNGIQQILENPAVRTALENGAEVIGNGIQAGYDGYNDYKKHQLRLAKERRDKLEAELGDPGTSAGRKRMIEQELMAEKNAAQAQRAQWQDFEGKALNAGLSVATEAATGALQEGFARLSHERELEKVGIQAVQNRKAAVEKFKAAIKAIKDNPGKIIGTATGISLGVFGMYFMLKHGVAHIADQLKKPALADPDETSLKFGPTNWLKSFIYGTTEENYSLHDVILKPELADRITESVVGLENTVANGGYLKNMMLWGQPGTGKTMLAKRMARSSGLHYIYFTASNLEPFSTEEASAQLIELFRFAKNHPKKLMIIIDEAEKLLGSRTSGHMNDKMNALLTLILGYTGTETRDYMVTILTNHPENIDEAFLSRCDDRIEIAAPAPRERRAILQLYVDKILKTGSNLKLQKPSVISFKYWVGKEETISRPTIEDGALSEKALDTLSDKLKGFVGRDISKLVIAIQTAALATEENKITTKIINRVADIKIAEKTAEKAGFKRH